MPSRTPIATTHAPEAIGPYSQGVAVGNLVFLSGQIPLDPATQALVAGSIENQARQVFRNLSAVADAAGGNLTDVVKLTLFLTDLADFQTVNAVMAEFFSAPYPARATVGIAGLPRGAAIEVDAIMVLRRSE
jgi:reactive intermediate/imine deaminase